MLLSRAMDLLKMNRHLHKLKIQPYTTNTNASSPTSTTGKIDWNHWKSTIEKHLKTHTKMDLNALKETIKSIGIFLGRSSSPIFAQRICRSYQVLHLHSRLWSTIGSLPPAGKSSSRILTSKLGPKPWFLSFIIFSLYDQKNNESKKENSSGAVALIEESELFNHMRDIDYIHELTASTVTCSECNNRLVVDKKLKNVQYCRCNHPVERDFKDKQWSPFAETPDLLIWRQPHETNSELFKYKVYGRYNDITPREFLATQLDLEYRKKWDTLVLNLELVDHDVQHGIDIVYWEMKWPKMFSNRDYCFARRFIVNEEDGTIVIMNKSIDHNKVPEKTGAVRVKEYASVMQIKGVNGLDQPGVEFGLTYYDNPGLSLPGWLLNWAAMTAIPDFLNNVNNATKVRRKTVSTKGPQQPNTHEPDKLNKIQQPSTDTEVKQSMQQPAATKQNHQSQSPSPKPTPRRQSVSKCTDSSHSNNQNQAPTSAPLSQSKETRMEQLSKFFKENILEAKLRREHS